MQIVMRLPGSKARPPLHRAVGFAREHWQVLSAAVSTAALALGVLPLWFTYSIFGIPVSFIRPTRIIQAGLGSALMLLVCVLGYFILLALTGSLVLLGRAVHQRRRRKPFFLRAELEGARTVVPFWVAFALMIGLTLSTISYPLRDSWLGGGRPLDVVVSATTDTLPAGVRAGMTSWRCRDLDRTVICEGVLLVDRDERDTLLADAKGNWISLSSSAINLAGRSKMLR